MYERAFLLIVPSSLAYYNVRMERTVANITLYSTTSYLTMSPSISTLQCPGITKIRLGGVRRPGRGRQITVI
jgi:hypothetical protein